MIVFDIDKYKGNYVMCCRTEKQAEVFCEYLDSVGRTWIGGLRYPGNTYFQGVSICYEFNQGYHASPSFYTREGYEILEFTDFIFPIYELDIDKQDVELLNEFISAFGME